MLLPEEVTVGLHAPRMEKGGMVTGREMWPEDSSALSPLKLDLDPALPRVLTTLYLLVGGHPT